MSACRLEERRIFLQHLAFAGWEVEGWTEVFDSGGNVYPEAEARYAGPVFDLRLEYHADHGYLLLEMLEREGDSVLRLHLYPLADIASLLTVIIAAQNVLNGENYHEFVKSLIAVCEPLLIETDEGLYRLS
jgi:hypothetical protein